MRRWIATGLLAAMMATALPSLALAGSSGRRNTALGLSGLAAYELLRGHTTVGALSAAGALYAWSRYSHARKQEKRRAAYYRSRYYSPTYSSYGRSPYYTSYAPNSRVRGYRSSYSRRGYRSSARRRGSSYQAGYRDGYRRGIRVCRAQHHEA